MNSVIRHIKDNVRIRRTPRYERRPGEFAFRSAYVLTAFADCAVHFATLGRWQSNFREVLLWSPWGDTYC